METIEGKHFTGERALFKSVDKKIINCIFDDGESPLKESKNLIVDHCSFGYKYPLWYGHNHIVTDSTFLEMSRSGIWYTSSSSFKNCDIIAPKLFRRCDNIYLQDITFHDASETLWSCENVNLKNITIIKGDYFGKDSKDIDVENLKIDGNYLFDGGKNIIVNNSIINSKDAFWNCENVTVKNSTIDGEYLGWNSKNLTFINCHIISHQGFCYIKKLTIKNSIIEDSDLIFEYCSKLDVDVNSNLLSVKNPISGTISAKGIDIYISDDQSINSNKVKIIKKG